MRLGSLCSGAGGLDMAVEAVFGAETLWHCESDAAASKVLAARWPRVPNHGDLINTDWSQVEPVDIICAGWPCQPFSLAGKRKGAEDERAIWPHIAGAIRILRPRYVCLENVSAVVGSGELWRVANSLSPLGYDLRWTCLRASEVGAPHGRERIFVAAHANSGGCQVVPQRDGYATQSELAAPQWNYSDRRCDGAVVLLPTPDANAGNRGPRSDHALAQKAVFGERLDRQKSLNDISRLLPTPTSRDHKGGSQTVRDATGGRRPVTVDDITRARGDGGASALPDAACLIGDAWGRFAPAIHRWETLTRPAPSPTEPNTKGNPRLNPDFSEWLMGWPAGWVTQVPGISRNDQLRIIGNGVVPQQAAAALSWLLSLSISEVAA